MRTDEWGALIEALVRAPHDRIAGEALLKIVQREAGRLSIPPDVDRDDLVQDVLVRLLRNPVALADVRHPSGYIRAALHNRMIGVWRQQRLIAAIEVEEVGHPFDDAAGRAEDQAVVRRLLASLSAPERRLIRMRFWRRQSITEIAKTLGVSYGSAAVKIFRLLKKLRDHEVLGDGRR